MLRAESKYWTNVSALVLGVGGLTLGAMAAEKEGLPVELGTIAEHISQQTDAGSIARTIALGCFVTGVSYLNIMLGLANSSKDIQ